MKVLIITQKVDQSDPTLGFFHDWVTSFSALFSKVTVVCLENGKSDLPSTVQVYSLGKEQGGSRFQYIVRALTYFFRLRKEYDVVFIHMNQEYVLIGALLWRLLGKPVFFWRNHAKGTILTRLAVLFSTKVFYTSPYSYTARFKKAVKMPVGVDTALFTYDDETMRIPRSILCLGRISPVKNLELLVDALQVMDEEYSTDIVGNALPMDRAYYEMIRQRAGEKPEKNISFLPGVAHVETAGLYQAHEIYVNMTASGSFDKTIIEAMASGALPVVCNESLRGIVPDMFIYEDQNPQDFSEKVKNIFRLSEEEKKQYRIMLRSIVVKEHSLARLASRLTEEMM